MGRKFTNKTIYIYGIWPDNLQIIRYMGYGQTIYKYNDIYGIWPNNLQINYVYGICPDNLQINNIYRICPENLQIKRYICNTYALSKHIGNMCMRLRNGGKSKASPSFFPRFSPNTPIYLYASTVHMYCIYPAILNRK